MEKIDKKEFGARLRRSRDDARITQDQIAEVCGKSRNAVSNWENGINFPEVEHLYLTCKLLGASSDLLLGLKGAESPISGIPPNIIKAAKKLAQLSPAQKEQIIGLIEGFTPAKQKEGQAKFDFERLGQAVEAVAESGLDYSSKKRGELVDRLYNNPALKTKSDFTAEIIRLSSRR